MIHETDFDAARAAMSGVNDPGRHLTATSPQPCWIALDAAREQAFTGEIVFDGDRDIRVYFDNGVAYYAERADGSTLGRRLVDAGLVDPAQLERGTVRVGGVEHLGRLFDRDASVDRDAVMVYTEDATESLLAELANHVITTSRATAYRHHESGVHRWFAAPPSTGYFTRPVSEVAPVDNSVVEDLPGLPSAESGSLGEDLRIEWDEPIGDVELTAPPSSNGDHALLLSDDDAGSDDRVTVEHPLRRADDASDDAGDSPVVGEVFWEVDRGADDVADVEPDAEAEPEDFVVDVDLGPDVFLGGDLDIDESEDVVDDDDVAIEDEDAADHDDVAIEDEDEGAAPDFVTDDQVEFADVDRGEGLVSPFEQPLTVDVAADPEGETVEPEAIAAWPADDNVAPPSTDEEEPVAPVADLEPMADPDPAVPVAEAAPPAAGAESLIVDLDALTPGDDQPELVYEPTDAVTDDDFVIVWPDGTQETPSAPADEQAPPEFVPTETGNDVFLETIAEIQAAEQGDRTVTDDDGERATEEIPIVDVAVPTDVEPAVPEALEAVARDVADPTDVEPAVPEAHDAPVTDVAVPTDVESAVPEAHDAPVTDMSADDDPVAQSIAGEVLLPGPAVAEPWVVDAEPVVDADVAEPWVVDAEPVVDADVAEPWVVDAEAVVDADVAERWVVDAEAVVDADVAEPWVVDAEPAVDADVAESWEVDAEAAEPWVVAEPAADADVAAPAEEPVITFGVEDAPSDEWGTDDELFIGDAPEDRRADDSIVTEDPVFTGPYVVEDTPVTPPEDEHQDAPSDDEDAPTEWTFAEVHPDDSVVTEDPVFTGPFVAEGDPSPPEQEYTESQLAAEPSFADAGDPGVADERETADPDAGPIDFEVPSLVLHELPESESAVPDEVSDAVLRAIRAIENASAVTPAVPAIAADEPGSPTQAEPAPLGFAPPTLDQSAEAIYAAAAREASLGDEPTGDSDDQPQAAGPAPEPRVASVVFVDDDEDDEPEPEDRAGALRRLINSLRRR